jgi:hypothetical protein
MAEKPKKPGLWSRYVGGLLGEDYENMTPEQRRTASMSVLGVIARGMGSPEAGGEALALTRAGRAAERKAADDARRTAAAEALMPQVVGRLFGGPAGRLESLPGGEGGELSSRYRQDPRAALAALYGSQAGRDLGQMAPDLAKLATEGTLGRTVGGSVYNPLTGGFTAPPQQAGTTTLTPAEVRQLGAPAGTIIQRDASGKLSVLPVPRAVAGGAAPRAAVGGGAMPRPGAPAAPGAPPAPGAGRLGNLLTADELRAAGLPEGTVAQFNPKTGQVNVLSQVPPAERTALGAKEIAVSRTESAGELLQEQLEKVSGGGPIGIRGAAARVFDSQDAALFETFKQQFSTALRAGLRLPGEGPMSDRDAALAGLTLPSLSFSKERNIQIIRALEDQVRLVAKLPTLKEEKPEGISTSDWLMMLPSERAAFKRAGAK